MEESSALESMLLVELIQYVKCECSGERRLWKGRTMTPFHISAG